MMVSTLATVLMMYALVYAPNNPVALAFILFLTGLFLSFGFSAFGIYPSAMTTKKAFPVAAALINTGGQSVRACFRWSSALSWTGPTGARFSCSCPAARSLVSCCC